MKLVSDIDLNNEEIAFLADCVMRPADARNYGQYYLLTPESFVSSRNGDIWKKFLETTVDDRCEISRFVTKALGIGNDSTSINDFLDHGSATEGVVADRAFRLATAAYTRKVEEVMKTTMAQYAARSDATSLASAITEAINAIPKPPSGPSADESRFIADEARKDRSEIPDRFLHIPGFVDDVVKYSMESAHVPNRTLSFAGALALTAHLMGRYYTDEMKSTRSNLFVFALAPSGAGKDWPRKVNVEILSKCGLGNTAFMSFESGQALEEVVYVSPRVFIQYDECQKLVQEMRNPSGVGQSILRFMMALYSASGGKYVLRSKAVGSEKNGRTVDDPSLTIFGTGNDQGTFRALTREAVEEGLLGRCLMLDTGVLNDDNTFDSGRPELSDFLVEVARAIAVPARQSLGSRHDPVVVPYADGARERLKEIKARKTKRLKEAIAALDSVAEALWSRAVEKVCKLALIYAVSENHAKPEITCEALDWSWEFVQMQMTRIAMRVNHYMSDGKVDEGCQRLIDFLVKCGGSCTRREFMNKNKGYDVMSMKMIEETLVVRGEITMISLSRVSVMYKLVKGAGRKGK